MTGINVFNVPSDIYCSSVRTRFICKSGFKGGNNFIESIIAFLVGDDSQVVAPPSSSLFPNTAYDGDSRMLTFRIWQDIDATKSSVCVVSFCLLYFKCHARHCFLSNEHL